MICLVDSFCFTHVDTPFNLSLGVMEIKGQDSPKVGSNSSGGPSMSTES